MTDSGSGDSPGDERETPDGRETPDERGEERVSDERAGSDAPREDRPASNDTPREDRPASNDTPREDGSDPSTGDVGYVEWLLTTDDPGIVVLRDIVSSVGTVVVVGLVLFAISGLWPPLVAVESGSMEPHMHRGDLVFVMEQERLAPGQSVAGTGVVTYEAAREVDRGNDDKQGYRSFGTYGNVIVYERAGRAGSPIIHRAHLYVEEGERWVERANDDYLADGATCDTVTTCPAPHDGFVTKGDANGHYDQAGQRGPRISGIVREEWIRGRAKARIPLLGHVRLLFGSVGTGSPGPAPAVGGGGGVTAASGSGAAGGGVAAASGSGGVAAASGGASAGSGVSAAGGARGVAGPTAALGGLLPLASRLLAVGGVAGALAYGTRD